MLKIYSCIVDAHDLRLVGLAAAVCGIASYAAVGLLRHAQAAIGGMRFVWLGVASLSTGFGIWATHFIAMLAYAGMLGGYDMKLTFVSLAVAILLTAAGLSLSLVRDLRWSAAAGGAIVGIGIAAMHYLGMEAMEVPGIVLWDRWLFAWSVAIGVVLAAGAVWSNLHAVSERWKLLGALLLTLAICGLHFTGMAALSMMPDPSVVIPPSALSAPLVAVAVGFASLLIILVAMSGVAMELRERRREAREAGRMRGLANGAIEGLLICDGDRIVEINDSFEALVGASSPEIVGTSLGSCFPDGKVISRLVAEPDATQETGLRLRDGSVVPVEVISRLLEFAGREHRVVAVRDLRSRREAERRIRHLALHDSLTGLPNRNHFNERLDDEIERARIRGERIAVLCLDLDRFKEVNDLFGHAAGDKVLQAVGRRVSKVIGKRSVLARLGGDEFAVFVPGLTDKDAAGHLAGDILAALARTDHDLDEAISSSIGVAIFPDDGKDREALLTHGDVALYRAKEDGRSAWRYFETSMGTHMKARRSMEHDLRQAVGRGEFSLVYQPQKSLHKDEITGFEALLRWNSPERGNVPPDVFVPVAEDTGSILQIGDWVMREACREAASWDRPLTIAVNVSAVQLYNVDFVAEIRRVLEETGLPASRLEIEITETALIRDFSRAVKTLRQVKDLGVHIAMDDFGTGYSSLSNLGAFPLDKIKIDKSFISSVDRNVKAATIVRAVLGIGRGLGLPVIAEGVETLGELMFLQNELCDEIQGYLLGKPAGIGEFRDVTHPGEDLGLAPQEAA